MERAEDGIAVVGIGCNFPGGEGLENFWKVLVSGQNCSMPIPKERFDLSAWYDPDDNKAGKSRTATAALIDGFNQFDHKFFGISDSEVEQMDPQQKQLLQCVYRALENAGIPMEKASGTRTGVYFGLMNRDYETNAAHVHPSVINHWTGAGLAMSIAANRVSYIFNFTGPSLAIDCACSSSLVALHLACQAIKQGDCGMAVCGGVNCITEPRVFVALSKAKMISPDGTCKPFSNKANGYGRGEGCGVVLLKPLTKALQDQDHIWGIISKTVVNQDGRSVSPITKPSMTQQEELLRMIYTECDLANVQYIEAHGTGTPIGDSTETMSLSNVIAKIRASDVKTLRIGSVKGNIGHTESAAGVAGLIKVLLMMKHGSIVPSVFFSEKTASVDFKALNMQVPTEVEKWEASGERVAGINNFGFGGTNAHAIVTQHTQSHRMNKKENRRTKYFVMSANSPKSLVLTLEDTIKRLDADIDLDHLLYTAACRRSHLKHKYRRACVVSSITDLKEKLQAAVNKNTTSPSLQDPKLVFVFCGNGLTYHGMGKQLLRYETVFRDKIEQISRAYQQLSSLNILDTLESESEPSDYNAVDVVQPLLFALQVGIATLLEHWGVEADAMLGHSVGEVAAAHCSGLLALEDALKVIYFRSVFQGEVTGGKMLVISNMAVSEVTALLPQYSGRVCLAAFNSPQSCTLSGDADAIQSLQAKLSSTANSGNLFIRVLEVPAAYHSHMMDPILPKIRKAIGCLVGNKLSAQLFSTVTGEEAQMGDFCSGDYWARNVREPVAFDQAVRSASQGKKSTVFVEIGPRRALQRNIMETLGNDTAVIASLQPDKDHETLASVVSKLFELGVHIDWNTFYAGYEAPPLPFPRYQFDSSDRDVIIKGAQKSTGSNHPVLCVRGNETNTFSCDLMSDSTFYLKEHKHNKVPIIPGAFYAELGLAAFMACAKPKVPLNSLQLSVNFHSPFVITPNPLEMKVQLEQKENEASFTVFSSSATYASGAVVPKKDRPVEEQRIDLKSIYKRCTSVVTYQEFYGYLAQGGFQYGEVFTNKANVHYGEDLKEAFALVTVPEVLRSQLHDYHVHPVLLDFLMQLLPVTVEHIFAGRPGFPAKIGSLTVLEPLQDEMTVYLRATDVGEDHFEVCGCYADRHGRTLVEVKHVLIKYLGSRSHVVDEYFYHNDFSVMSEGITNEPPPMALVFSDNIGIAKALQPYLDSRSCYISITHAKDILSHGFPYLLAKLNVTDIKETFDEVLFIWGKENLNSFTPDDTLQNLSSCCEIFRQIVLELKRIHFPNSIRAVTYCSSELTVDHINPGFAIVGMTRSLAAEIAELSFQLVDISSSCAKDIAALSEVLRAYPCSKYPELVVRDGVILKPSIARTPLELTDKSEETFASNTSEPCIFQTADAFKMSRLSAVPVHADVEPMSDTSVEISPTKLCVHSSEYFPVSASHLNFGQTLYWNKHSAQNHKLLMLDFSGIVTKVGKDVRKLKVGDSVASCYPVVAASRVRVPQDVCYTTKQLPFLQTTPCVSFFVLAREILCRVFPKAKHLLGIISPIPDSVLVKVLTIASQKAGWNVIVGTHGLFKDAILIDALIVLPPYNKSLIAEVCNFPGVKNVVLVQGSQTQRLLVQDELQNVKESVHVQKIDIPVLLQKGSLSARRLGVYHWLKSFNLSKKFSLESFTFQSSTADKIQSLSLEKPESYFHAKKLAVVTLEKGQTTATSNIPLLCSKKQLFRKRSVYIVVGGLTGLGFETVKFISQKGGEVVITLSRSKPSAEVQQEIQNIEKQCGNKVVSMQCDIAVYEQVHKVIRDIQLKFQGYPIRGVFHSAVVLHDALIESLDISIYEEVLKPKVNGVLNLHKATLSCQLDYFVCYSSISAFLGNASQTNYAAANTFLDLFCQYRRKLGLPAQSINWGALNLGLLLNKESFHRFLEAKGIMVLMVAEIHKSLEQCLLLNRPQQAICRFHFRNIRFNILSQNVALTMRLSALVEQALQKSRELNSQSINMEEVPARDYVISLFSKTVGMDISELKDDTPLLSLGTDSMQAMTLQNLIYQDRGVNVPLVKLLDPNATLATVVAILNEGRDCGTHDHNTFSSDDTSTVSTRF
uniref:Fatty acid synthase 2 n=2 Tax=Hippocampus comes TaxID=109280 RepID=A0A3Q2YXK3_HIPCM